MEKILKPGLFLIAGVILVLVGYSAGSSKKSTNIVSNQFGPTETSIPSISLIGELSKVTRVIDGDTIEVEGGKRVRLIGIDTPEINRTGETGCFGKEAADYAAKLLDGQMVKMEKDVSEVDRYNRLLRYIYLGDIMVNDKLVRDGYAKVYTYPPDVKYKDKFLESEKYARENNLGLWSKCTSSPVPDASGSSQSSVSGQQTSVDCSHNTYNCGDFKTQAEAQNVFDYCMKSVGYDVHKLDRDNDGRVCETLP